MQNINHRMQCMLGGIVSIVSAPRYVCRTANSQRTDVGIGFDKDTCVELRLAIHRRHIRCRRGFESSLRARGRCNVDDAACDAHRAYQTRTGNRRPRTRYSFRAPQLAADLRSRSHVTGSDAKPRRCRIYPIDRVPIQLYPAGTADDELPSMIRRAGRMTAQSAGIPGAGRWRQCRWWRNCGVAAFE